MKGIRGLILALVAGLAATVCNWLYLQGKANDVEKIGFLGLKKDVTLVRGERLTESQLEEVLIPKQWIGNLDKYAYHYADRQSVVGMSVARTQVGPVLLLQQDLRTPPPELNLTPSNSLATGEGVLWVPVDAKGFVPSLVAPGEDMVSFLIASDRSTPTLAPPEKVASVQRAGKPEPGKPEAGKSEPAKLEPTAVTSDPLVPPPAAAASPELIGPFKVLALGNRMGSSDVMRAAKIAQTQENVIGILAKIQDGKLEPKAARLWSMLQATNFRNVSVYKHAPQSKDAN